jgi:ATP-binding protein involved in chromosome partitioning
MKVEEFMDPYLGQSWQALGAKVLVSGKRISVTLGYPAQGLQYRIAQELAAFLGVDDIELDLGFSVASGRGFGQVKNVVLVSSGKGGVGKSTTAVNLALALDAEGAKVGLLDADIYGPSQGMMLGVAEGRRPDIKDGKFFEPIRAHGLKAMSMSFMITDKTPMVWRGPMASGALQQILGQTLWGDLDYLIVDMPPGTGDIQLTLSQKAPVAGAVIVTTPQDIALLDALKGVEMFSKVDIPVLGILENMSVHCCDNCGHISHLFGEDGGKRIAENLGVPLLGQLPLAMSIREQADGGNPTVKAEPDSGISQLYVDAARNMAARLWANQATAPTITMVDD